jgi:hypothetical protein
MSVLSVFGNIAALQLTSTTSSSEVPRLLEVGTPLVDAGYKRVVLACSNLLEAYFCIYFDNVTAIDNVQRHRQSQNAT